MVQQTERSLAKGQRQPPQAATRYLGKICRGQATAGLFFWRDRTRKVNFLVDVGGRLEIFEAEWTEVPTAADAVNLDFVSSIVGRSRIQSDSVVCRTSNPFPLGNGFRAVPVSELV